MLALMPILIQRNDISETGLSQSREPRGAKAQIRGVRFVRSTAPFPHSSGLPRIAVRSSRDFLVRKRQEIVVTDISPFVHVEPSSSTVCKVVEGKELINPTAEGRETGGSVQVHPLFFPIFDCGAPQHAITYSAIPTSQSSP